MTGGRKLPVPELSSGPDFDFIRDLVRDRTAINLDESKLYLVNARLLPITRTHGFGSVLELVRHLRAQPFADLHRIAVEAVVTTETSFFRDFYPYEALEQEILPDLIEDRRSTSRTLNIWSAGCSSGQEPYSIAMLIRSSFPELASWNIRLLASDVSQGMLERSRAGVYSQVEVNRGLPAPMLVKYFRPDGPSWSIADEIRNMVTFFHHNLARDTPTLPPVDILSMRNVLIYFDVETKRRVLERVRRHLRNGGLLMLGTAETTLNLDENFERLRIGRAVFYRTTGRNAS
jgi:chemotaxis protein methyltransferase CheR